jgi:DNA-binding transcriptional regulator GbsR (MarR family)
MSDSEDVIGDVRRGFVELWGRLGSFWGVPPTTARVYGWLLARPEPASADEIVAGLGMSRGSVSMACRELADWGLVHAERGAGGRQRAWRPETDLERAIRSIVATRKRREWDPILANLREWIPALAADPSPEAERFRERLEAIESLVGTADSLAESFLAGGLVQELGLKALIAAAKRKRPAKGSKGGKR